MRRETSTTSVGVAEGEGEGETANPPATPPLIVDRVAWPQFECTNWRADKGLATLLSFLNIIKSSLYSML